TAAEPVADAPAPAETPGEADEVAGPVVADDGEPEVSGEAEAHAPAPAQETVGLDRDFLSSLPLAVLVHAGDELYYANPDFLELTGYASLAQIRREGGLGRLFADDELGDGERKPRLR